MIKDAKRVGLTTKQVAQGPKWELLRQDALKLQAFLNRQAELRVTERATP